MNRKDRILKKWSVVILLIFTLFSSSAFARYSGGSGNPADPYRIGSKEDLLSLAENTPDYGSCFILTADINMTGQVFTMAIIAAIPSNNPLIEPWFTGTFDGNDHKITNFSIDGEDQSYLGLFGYLSGQSSVKNLGLENFAVSGSSDSQKVGGLAGVNSGNITNCYSTGTVNIPPASLDGDSIGGLIGNNSGIVRNCHVTGSVNGYYMVGGLIGSNSYGSIINCYTTGVISGAFYTGGLVGASYYGNITLCYSTGTINGLSDSAWGLGGLAGDTFNDVFSNCYSTSTVNGFDETYIGGLIGINESNITNCYSTGVVSGSDSVGGMIGYNSGTVTASFWDVNTSGTSSSAGGTGKTTAEMKKLSTFLSAGWDFVNMWGIGNGQTYPYLKQFNGINPADLNYSGIVDFEDFAVLAENWLVGAIDL